jgi:catechol 2,3-dioxygenase-like lactoylglutathione lyase family enzyme
VGQTLAALDGVAVEATNRPGGGQKVRLSDPDGFVVEVIAGGMLREADPAPKSVYNWNGEMPRASVAKRIGTGPSQVARLGHAVFIVSDLELTWQWWSERFGLLMSDDVRAPDGNRAAIFIRCDRGATPSDHHTLNFAGMPGAPAAFHRAAFEVGDVDDLMKGHEHLEGKGYQHSWGVGRHILGSQIFDYWLDPFGHRVEHWTDGDVFAADVPTNVTDLPTMLGMQWGPPPPVGFV